jgi:hypothetical protein
VAGFSAYFDASGHEEDPQREVLSMAGYIAPVEQWIEWERDWRRLLGQHGLAEFHMAEYIQELKTSKDKEPSLQKLLHDLVDSLKPLSRQFGCTIPCQEYKKRLSSNLLQQFDLKAYVIAGRSCVEQVAEWCRREGSPPLAKVLFFFERGDSWQSELRGRLLEDGFPEPHFQPKRDNYNNGTLIEPGLIPFQAADMLAYIAGLIEKFSRRNTDWGALESVRWMEDALLDVVQGSPRYFTDNDWAKFETVLQVNDCGLIDPA